MADAELRCCALRHWSSATCSRAVIGISAVGHHQERRRRAHNNVTGPITGGQIARLDDIRGQRGSSDRKGEESSEEDRVGMSILSDRLR